MTSSLSIQKPEFQLIRQEYASNASENAYVAYSYEKRVIANGVGLDSYGMITGPIRRKSMIMPVLRSDRDGGNITHAEYNSLKNDISSSLKL